jgi:glyoxylase-like metal-dependent hydrolase (beta-lactamase superfamily II)
MKLFEDFYAYPWQGNDNNCNSYVFAGVLDGGKHVVVDPGHRVTPYYREPGLERLIQGMDRDGIGDAGIGLVILTHGHPDHSESAIVIRNEYQALVAIHQADEPSYSAIGGKADIFLDEGNLELGAAKSTSLQIYHSPGHTPGHVTIYWPARGALIAGDCIFYRSTGRADLPGGNARILKQSIEKLSALPIEHLLCGHAYGHSGIISGREEVRDNFRYIENLFY